MWQTSSVNSFNCLQLDLFRHIDNELVRTELRDFINDDFLQGIMHQFYIKEYNGDNYIVILNQNYSTKNYNISVYRLTDNKPEQIATFLVYYLTDEILIEVNTEFKELNLKG